MHRWGALPPAPRVVLLHGFTQSGPTWRSFGDALADRSGVEVLAPDLPGHGGSATVDADLPHSASLVAAACGPAVYVGYSMGGRVALHLALQHPEVVRGLVLVGATPGLETEAERAARRADDEGLAKDLERDGLVPFLDRWLALPLFATLPADASAMEERLGNTVHGLATSLRRCGTGTQQPLWDRLGAITSPVRLLAGALDDKFLALARRMADAIPGASVHPIARSGHACHLERPDDVLAIVAALCGEPDG